MSINCLVVLNKPKTNTLVKLIEKGLKDKFENYSIECLDSSAKEERSEYLNSGIKPNDVIIGDGNLDNGEYLSNDLLQAIEKNPQAQFILFSADLDRCENFKEQASNYKNVRIILNDGTLFKNLKEELQEVKNLMSSDIRQEESFIFSKQGKKIDKTYGLENQTLNFR